MQLDQHLDPSVSSVSKPQQRNSPDIKHYFDPPHLTCITFAWDLEGNKGIVHGDLTNINSKNDRLVEECVAMQYGNISIDRNSCNHLLSQVLYREIHGI